MQDYDGFIWMIGEKGITKYDGTNARIFTTNDGLPTNDIWNIRITGDNKVWFFSSSKQHGYIENDIVHKFSPMEQGINMIPHDIVQYKNTVGFYNLDFQLIELVNNKWTVINSSKVKKEYILNSKYAQSLVYARDSIFVKTNKNEIKFVLKQGKRGPYFSLFPDNKLFLVIDNTIQVIELNTLKIYRIQLDDYNLNLKHKIGIGYMNNSYQLTGYNFVLDLDSNLEVNNIYKIDPKLESYFSMRDRLGNIWIASFNNGIYFLSYSESKTVTYDLGTTKELKIIFDRIHFITKKKNFGTFENGEAKLKYTNETEHDVYTYIEVNNKINICKNRTIILDSNYNFIENVSTWNAKKIVKINNTYYASHHYESEELDSNFNVITNFNSHLKDVIKFNDTVFIATYNGLFYRYKNEFIKHPINFSKPINSFAISGEHLLIGSDGHGLYKYKNGEIIKLFKNISFIEKVKVYNDSNIFAATNKGLYAISNRNSKFKLTYIYNINDGLKSNLVNDVLLVNDDLFIATSNGITRIRKDVKNLNQLQSIHINKIIWNEDVVNDTNLKVKYTRNNSLEVDFSTINFTIKNYLKYSYKLSPTQKNFIQIPKGQINLNNLPIGNYELIIKVEDEKNNSLSKSIFIEILPNWYQTKLFYLLLGIILLLIILFLLKNFRNRISKNANKKIEQEKQLSNFKLEALRSQMNPHFVFNSLNAIQYYMNENDLEMSDKYLLKFSRLIRHFFDLSNVTEISLEKEVDLISNYLEIEKMRFKNKLDFEVNIEIELIKDKLNIPTMIIQPIVENAINHGIFHKKEGGKVNVMFKKISNNSYEVIVNDNGIGIVKSKEIKANSFQGHDSKSSLIFKERIKLLNKSNKWIVSYTMQNFTENIDYPGTEVKLIFTKNDNSNIN